MPLTDATEATLSTLLRQARNAHTAYRQFTPHIRVHNGQRQTNPGDAFQARVSLEAARSRLAEAHALDPQHQSDAWLALGADHGELDAFYAAQLAK